MDKKQITAFVERMDTDPALREAFTAFAEQHGLNALAEELGQGDLDQVAGGIDTVPLPERPRFRTPQRGPTIGTDKGIIDTNTRGIIDTNT